MDYVIGDIHGCNKTLNALLNKIGPTEDDHLFFLGDYIDRGSDSKGVLNTIMKLKIKTCLLGNHEDMMIDALIHNRPHAFDMWAHNGGRTTISSYGGKIDKEHLSFLCKECGLIIDHHGFYMTHAGIDPINPMDCDRDFYLWDRGSSPPIDGKILIVGHTPKKLKQIEASLSTKKIYLDNGCVFLGSKGEGYANLVALRLDDRQLFIQPCIDGE